MTWPLHEVTNVAQERGADAALPLLAKIMPTVSIDDLRQALVLWEAFRIWPLMIPVWLELIRRFTAEGPHEQAAYFWNEFGDFLRDVGDDRALGCFRKALALTKEPGRRMRTLGRMGDFLAIVRQERDRAIKLYQGGIAIGDRYGSNPLHVMQLRMRIIEVERDRQGMSLEFRKLREQTDRDREKFSGLLRTLEMPL